MEHLLLKAATTASTDEGVFEAVISAATVDRERDIVDPAGMVRALHKWVPLGKKIPLAWNHSTRPEDQIGYVDPATARVAGNEVVANGWVDQSTENGQHAWRCVKAGTLGFSFGYMVPPGGSSRRKGGGKHITELDVFEVTATPTPMNGDTRVLGWKAAKGHADVGPHARYKLRNLIKYYMEKPHPFTACVHDNAKRFGVDGADRVCLAGDTPVNTATGEKRIDGLRVGDLVWSYNESNGRFELKPIVWHGLTRRKATVVRVTLETGEKITATPDHPFLCHNGEWADAGSLREGDLLLSPTPGRIFPMTGSAETCPFADSALAKANVLGPRMTPGAVGVLSSSAAARLNFLMPSDDLADLGSSTTAHQRFDHAHDDDGCVPVDAPLVVDLSGSVGLTERADAPESEDVSEPLQRLGKNLDRVNLGGVATAMKSAVDPPLVGHLVAAEAALALEEPGSPSDVGWCQVAEVTVLEEGKDVWDIEVADNHTFVVHGSTVVHNCATLKDVALGTTHWRNRKKALPDVLSAPADDQPTDQDLEDMGQELLDAAEGNLEALVEMWHEYMLANGDEPPEKAVSPEELRAEADSVSRQFALRGARKQAEGDQTTQDEPPEPEAVADDEQTAPDPDCLRAEAQALSRKHALRGARKQAETDADESGEDEDDPAELLGQMISMAQDFIDDEDDPDDVNLMRQVMGVLLKLQGAEANEGGPDDTGKSFDPAEIEAMVKAARLSRLARPKADGEMAKLRENVDEQAARVKQLESDLEAANRKLTERTPDLDTLRRFSDAVKLDAVKGSSDHAKKVAAQAAEELSSAYAEQAERLQSVEQELEAAKKQLVERTADVDTLRRASDAVTLNAVKNRRRNGNPAAASQDGMILIAGSKAMVVRNETEFNALPSSSKLAVYYATLADGD